MGSLINVGKWTSVVNVDVTCYYFWANGMGLSCFVEI